MNYYYLVTGLPDINVQDKEVSKAVAEEVGNILNGVNASDRHLLELYMLKHDNANLLSLLKGKTDKWENGGIYDQETLAEAIEAVRNEGEEAETDVPHYMKQFLVSYLSDDASQLHGLYPDSLLSELYFAEAGRCKNAFVAQWFEFTQNVNNLLTAANCRRLGLDLKPYIVGDNAVSVALRTSTANDWGLQTELDYFDQVMQIASGTDGLAKERQLDEFRVQWSDELSTFSYFGIERLFCFLQKIDIISRWAQLDSQRGEEKLREMIAQLKSEVK